MIDDCTLPLRVFGLAQQLSAVNRFARDHMHQKESVLEHMGFCLLYATHLGQRARKENIAVNFEVLLKRVCYHDVDECVLGDVPRTTKYFNEKISEEFRAIEEQTVEQLESWLCGGAVFNYWKDAKDKNIEGEIMRLTDLAAVIYKVWVEVCLYGNRSFRRVAAETNKYANAVCERAQGSGYTTIRTEAQRLLHLTELVLSGPAPGEFNTENVFFNFSITPAAVSNAIGEPHKRSCLNGEQAF